MSIETKRELFNESCKINESAKCKKLFDKLEEALYDNAIGMPLPSILGVLELLKNTIIEEQE